MNFERKIASDGAITIYIPRAFQRAVPHPLILQHVRKPKLLVRLGRFRAIFDIRSRRSSIMVSSLNSDPRKSGILTGDTHGVHFGARA